MNIPLGPRDIVEAEEFDRLIAMKADKPRAKAGRKPGDPTNSGRPCGITMPCGWGCGFEMTASTRAAHWMTCERRPDR